MIVPAGGWGLGRRRGNTGEEPPRGASDCVFTFKHFWCCPSKTSSLGKRELGREKGRRRHPSPVTSQTSASGVSVVVTVWGQNHPDPRRAPLPGACPAPHRPRLQWPLLLAVGGDRLTPWGAPLFPGTRSSVAAALGRGPCESRQVAMSGSQGSVWGRLSSVGVGGLAGTAGRRPECQLLHPKNRRGRDPGCGWGRRDLGPDGQCDSRMPILAGGRFVPLPQRRE